MSDAVIRVENLGKLYRIGAPERYKTLRDSLTGAFTQPFRRLRSLWSGNGASPPDSTNNTFWALKDVSFEVKRGEVIGIIGRNGAGKSTLLKILSRITEPTEGFAEIRGRVRSLLEVGTGFHPELTGRENIYLNGAILGMRKAEIQRKFDEIVAFSEVEKFIDTPVKHYSSGMYVRLAFAVAAHLEPEILIVDEVLSVGDAQFQNKCLGKMDEVAKQGRTVLFVSHNMAAVLSLCGSAYLLERGSIACSGASDYTVGRYLQNNTMSASAAPIAERTDRSGDGKVRIISLSIASTLGSEVIRCSDGLQIRIGYTSDDSVRRPAFLIGVYDHLNRRVFFLDSRDAGGVPEALPAAGIAVCTTEPINLTPGMYSLNIAVLVTDSIADHIAGALFFEVAPEDFFGTGRLTSGQLATCLLRQQWKITNRG